MATWSFCVNTRTKTIRIGWTDNNKNRLAISLFSHISYDTGKNAEHGKEGEPIVVGEPREIKDSKEQNATVDERQTNMFERLLRDSIYCCIDLDKESKWLMHAYLSCLRCKSTKKSGGTIIIIVK